jgi:hypothetical protein
MPVGEESAIRPTRSGHRATRAPPCTEQFYVYVIELRDAIGERIDPSKPIVYVGQSCHEPSVRFRQHLDGYKASRHVRKFGVRLRPRLYARFNPLPSRGAAEAAEREVGRRLRRRGYTVYGAH